MKYFVAPLCICALLSASACRQSPQHLVEAGNRYHDRKKFQEASILYRKAIAKDKTYAEAYYREGLNLLDEKNVVESARFFRRAVDLNPANRDAGIRLSEIYLTAYAYDQKKFRGLLPEVRELTAKILTRDPNDFHGIRLQAFLALADKDVPKAIESFRQADRLKPYSTEVVGWLAQVLTADNQFDEAEKLARGMIAHNKSWGPAYDFLFTEYTKRKRPAEAEAVLKERVANDPRSEAALTNYANYLLQAKRYGEAEAQMRTVLSEPKVFPNRHQMLGDFYMRSNHLDLAIHQYKAGVDAVPEDKLAYQIRMVGALARQGVDDPAKQVDALNFAKRLSKEYPKDIAATELYAALLLDIGVNQDAQKALTELRALVKSNNADPMLHFDLARAYYGQMDVQKAQSEAAEAVRLRPSFMPARVLSARLYEDNGQHGKALEQVAIVLDKNPADAPARLIRARALAASKETDNARGELEALIAQNPGYGDAMYQLARLYVAGKEYGKAQELFQKLWLGPGPDARPDLRGFIGLQEVKLRQGQWPAAIDAMNDLVQKNPKQPSLRYTLATFQADAATSLPKTDPQRPPLLAAAERSYEELAKGDGASADFLLRLGLIQQMQGRDEAALASFEKAGKANPGSAEAFLNRAMVLEAMGRTDKARAAYNQTLGVDPDNVVALNNLAFMSADTNQNLDEAMTYAERAKKRRPDSPNVADTLGYVYYRKQLTDDAVRELQSAVDRDPKNAGYRLHLAMALLKRGDKSAAKKEAESALKTADAGQQQKIRTFMSQIS